MTHAELLMKHKEHLEKLEASLAKLSLEIESETTARGYVTREDVLFKAVWILTLVVQSLLDDAMPGPGAS